MSKSKAKFKVGQVVAYRRMDEAIYRYGRIHEEYGLLWDTDSFKTGYRILDGVRFEIMRNSQLRPLTKREANHE